MALSVNATAAEVSNILQVPGGRRGYDLWLYKGGYWEAREAQNWEGCRDIYGPGPSGQQPPKLLLDPQP